MILFTVHEPPSAPADKLDRAEAIVFVRDGFSLVATVLGPLWLLMHQLWLAAVIVIGSAAIAGFALYVAGAGPVWIVALLAAMHLVIGFEGRNIERWTLARRGWAMLGSVQGRDVEECERRFFEAWLPKQPFITQDKLASTAGTLREAASGPGGLAGAAGPAPRRGLFGRLFRGRA